MIANNIRILVVDHNPGMAASTSRMMEPRAMVRPLLKAVRKRYPSRQGSVGGQNLLSYGSHGLGIDFCGLLNEALWTNAMDKHGLGMLFDVGLEGFPITPVVSDLVAPSAYGK
jgi:hypothetical protein